MLTRYVRLAKTFLILSHTQTCYVVEVWQRFIRVSKVKLTKHLMQRNVYIYVPRIFVKTLRKLFKNLVFRVITAMNERNEVL